MSTRRTLPPWERSMPHPRHPTGRARRRWPRAYDGGEPGGEPVQRRYRRQFDREQRVEGKRGVRHPLALETLRQSPVRNGLIGLAVAGAAAPIALNRYQSALRADPSHERMTLAASPETEQLTERAVTQAWKRMEARRVSQQSEREQVIERHVQKYSDYGLSRELAEDIYDMAVESNVDPELAFGLVRAESSFKNTSTSRVGAVGLTQLMPKTAAWLEPGVTTSELRNPETNLRIGMKYLRQLIDKYEGDEGLALTAYNRGPGTVDRILKRGGDPDNGYARFVRTGDVGSHEG